MLENRKRRVSESRSGPARFVSVREMKLWWKHTGTLDIHSCSATFQGPWAEYGRLSLRVSWHWSQVSCLVPLTTGLLSSALAFALTAVLDLCIDHELLKALKTKLKSLLVFLVFLVFLEASPAAQNHCVVDDH